MRRREVIAALLLAAPIIGRAKAQEASKVHRIALVNPDAADSDMSETGDAPHRSFFRRLRELGYIEGQNLSIARYSAKGRTEDFNDLVREAVRSNPDLIVALGNRLVTEVKAATETIPVVAVVADPVRWGIVTSIARPGRNITGVAVDGGIEQWAKYLELLHEIVPAASKVGYLASRRLWESAVRADSVILEAAQRLKISLVGPPLAAPIAEAEYHRVFAAMAEEGVDALYVNNQHENFTNRQLIVELAEKYRFPAIYLYREFTEIGGLISYGVNLNDTLRQAAEQIDLILKGTQPGDIPFRQPTKFELVINLKTAKALGITVPPTLLIAADEVIE
jgi:putative ABC transport system substrate-binding protein